MSDIRINALATTASTTASDDYIAIDGSANGTRKLSAYSPTFGGNLTVASSNTAGYGFSTITHTPPYIRQHAVETLDIVGGYNGTRILTNGGASTVVSIDSAGLATFGGNLTVSGTATASGGAAITLNGSTGKATINGYSGGWQTWYGFNGSAGTFRGGFGGYGNTDALSYYFIGDAYNSNFAQFASSGTTLAGNLTVSGTGGSTFNAASVATPGFVYQANQAFRIISTTTAEVQQAFLSGGNFGYYIQVGGSNSYPLMLQPSGSNVLLGTTTDSSNGKLQLATHTTSAGGIGFGTDVSLYREASSILTFSTSTHNYLKFLSSAADRQQALLFNQSGNSGGIAFEGGTRGNYIGITVNGVEGVQITGTSATFAGTIATQGGTASTPASASATGTAGTIRWDASYIYVCTATNTWKRAAIATW